MSKKLQKITTMSAAAVLATTAIVPVAASAATTEAPATEVTHVIFKTDQGVLASLPMETYEQAVAAGALKSEGATHIKLGNGEVYLMETYEQAIAAGLTPEQAAQKLIDDVQAIDEKVYDGKVENGKVVTKDDITSELAISSVEAINLSTVAITFNKAIDEVKAEDFKVEGTTVKSISVSEDKKTVQLVVEDMNYATDYKVVAKVDGQTFEKTFKTPAVTDLWTLDITVEPTIIANGVDTEVVKFELKGEDGKVDENANDVVLDINSTFGYLSQKRVTIQKGKAEVILRSEFFADEKTAKIDAQIIEAAGKEYKELIGKVVGTQQIKFIPEGASNGGGEQIVVKSLVSANSNEADRVTLLFDEEMTNGDFYHYVNGEVKLRDNLSVWQGEDKFKDIWAVAIDPANKKKVIVYLNKEVPAGTTDDKIDDAVKENVLQDNKDVYVSFKDVKVENKVTKTFKLADARVPNVTSVDYVDPRTVTVKFSEGIHKAKFVIDGQMVEGKDFKVTYGDIEFKDNKWVDNRNVATIKLNDGNYFESGKHSLETSSIYDFAALTDSKNIGSTQVLQFSVPEDNERAVAMTTVDSPEQIHLAFNKDVKLAESDIKFEVKVGQENGKDKWVSVKDHNFGGEKAEYIITQPKDNTYKLELTKDWTVIYNTKDTKQNHYNDEFRLVLPKGKVTTLSNGKKNEEDIVIDLMKDATGEASVLAKPDIYSPVIKGMKTNKVNKKVVDFDVFMSEPVKLNGFKDSSNVDTPAQNQVEIPKTQVEFFGTYEDKDGNVTTYTMYGKVQGYNADDSTDKTIKVMWLDSNEEGHKSITLPNGKVVNTPQEFVDAGGNTDWTLVVKSISDDVGNTAATNNFGFVLEPTEKPAEVVKPFMVQNGENGKALGDGTYSKGEANGQFSVEGKKGEKNDQVFITYTEAVAITGPESAIDVKNYTLNGKDLPTGATIAVEKVADDKSQTVVITLPKETLNDSNVITLAKQISSKAGEKLNFDKAFTFKVGSNLANVIKKAEELNEKGGELEGLLTKDIADANAVLNDPKASDKDKDAAAEKLQNAINKATDTKAIEEARAELDQDIAAAEKDKEKYEDPAAVQALADAAKEVANDDNATVEELNAAKDGLAEELAKLPKKVTEVQFDKLDKEIYDFTLDPTSGLYLMDLDDTKLPVSLQNETLELVYKNEVYPVTPNKYGGLYAELPEDPVAEKLTLRIKESK